MPKNYKTPGTLVAELKMTRMSHLGALLLVEGSDDLRFWSLRHHEGCEPVLGENKMNIVAAMPVLDAQHFKGALGVVDSDYDTLTGVRCASENLVTTDAHDLECLLFRTSALDAVMAEFGDPDKVTRLQDESGVSVRQNLLERAAVFGRLRWAAIRHRDTDGLTMIKIPRFVDEQTWTVDEQALMRTIPNQSAGNADLWAHRIAALPHADSWYLAQGHDMIDILRIGLRRVLGSIKSTVGRKEIARLLRQSAPLEELKATGLYTDIRNWEASNPPFAVLKAYPAGDAP